jgi:hypothetical protein
MTPVGLTADERPIVCLGSDSRHWGLKNFDKNLAPMNSRTYTRHKLWSKLNPKKRLIGYARVSTYGQTLDSQLELEQTPEFRRMTEIAAADEMRRSQATAKSRRK